MLQLLHPLLKFLVRILFWLGGPLGRRSRLDLRHRCRLLHGLLPRRGRLDPGRRALGTGDSRSFRLELPLQPLDFPLLLPDPLLELRRRRLHRPRDLVVHVGLGRLVGLGGLLAAAARLRGLHAHLSRRRPAGRVPRPLLLQRLFEGSVGRAQLLLDLHVPLRLRLQLPLQLASVYGGLCRRRRFDLPRPVLLPGGLQRGQVSPGALQLQRLGPGLLAELVQLLLQGPRLCMRLVELGAQDLHLRVLQHHGLRALRGLRAARLLLCLKSLPQLANLAAERRQLSRQLCALLLVGLREAPLLGSLLPPLAFKVLCPLGSLRIARRSRPQRPHLRLGALQLLLNLVRVVALFFDCVGLDSEPALLLKLQLFLHDLPHKGLRLLVENVGQRLVEHDRLLLQLSQCALCFLADPPLLVAVHAQLAEVGAAHLVELPAQLHVGLQQHLDLP
mmetsp:Transcript_99753/g.311416  ORF Transcript_99753/g.311416 Transcript_99753/m.311416 type:complete len:446 (+) Transcript_99753:1672-3009(+)